MPKNKRVHPFRFAPSAVVGLEILHDRISAIVLQHKKNQWTVLKTVKKDIPPSLDGSTRAIRITEVLDELDVKPKQVVTSLNSSDMIVKIVSLPPLQNPEQELPQLMEYELERQLPIPLSQAAYDYQIIQPEERIDIATSCALDSYQLPLVEALRSTRHTNKDLSERHKAYETTVLLAAVRRNKLNDHLALMENADISPIAVMPSFLMFLNGLFVSGLLSPRESGFIGAVRLSASVVDVVVVDNGVLSFARSFAPKVFATLTDDFVLRETPKDSQIDEVKMCSEASPTPSAFGSLPSPTASPYGYDFLRELHNTLRDFLPKTGKHQLLKLLIVTEDESLPFYLTMEQLTEALAFPHCEHKIMPDGFALGLATGYLNMPHTLSLNLMTPLLKERRAKKKIQRKERALRFGPVGAMFALAATAIFLLQKTDIAQTKLTQAKAAQQLFEQKVNEKVDLEKLSSNLSRQIEALRWVDAGYPSLSYRLYQVAQSVPQNIWLKEINTPPQPKRIKKEIPVMDTLILTGYASSQADIDNFTQRLRKLSCFCEVQQVNTEERIMNKQKVLLFQLSLNSEKANTSEQ